MLHLNTWAEKNVKINTSKVQSFKWIQQQQTLPKEVQSINGHVGDWSPCTKRKRCFFEGSKGLHKQSQFLSCRTKTIRISTPELKWDFKYLSPCIKELISFSTRRAPNRATISWLIIHQHYWCSHKGWNRESNRSHSLTFTRAFAKCLLSGCN